MLKLLDIVQKQSNSDNVFVNINNDLSLSIKNFDYSLKVLCSYGLSRKFAAAGLFLQGFFTKEDYFKVSNFFDYLQNNLSQREYSNFKLEYETESLEYLQSYDKNLTIDTIKSLIIIVDTSIKSNTNYLQKLEKVEYNKIINFIYTLIPNQDKSISIPRIKKGRRNFWIYILILFLSILILLFYYDNDISFQKNFLKELEEIDS